MFYDHQAFVAAYEQSFAKLTASQYKGIDQLLSFVQLDPDIDDDRWVAYMLATVKHECANTFQPITEFGADSYFAKYEAGTALGRRLGNTQPGDGLRFKGRGYVQITGRANYLKLGQAVSLGTAFVDQPARVLEPVNAYRIMSIGMRKGLFTGKKTRRLHQRCQRRLRGGAPHHQRPGQGGGDRGVCDDAVRRAEPSAHRLMGGRRC